MADIPVYAYVMVASTIFAIGLWGILTTKNAIRLLMSVELLINAANLNFVAFAMYLGNADGLVYTLFSIAIAAGEAAVGLAIFINLYRLKDSVNVTRVATMRW